MNQPSQSGINLIHEYEKCSLSPYQDNAGVWTVGWGHAMLDAQGRPIRDYGLAQQYMIRKFGAWTISQYQADEQSVEDIGVAAASLNGSLTMPATIPQFDAMTSLVFNIGGHNFFGSSVRRLHNAGQHDVGNISLSSLYQFASNSGASPLNMPEAFASWSHENHVLSLGLFRRRMAELLLYSGWDWSTAYQTAEAFSG